MFFEHLMIILEESDTYFQLKLLTGLLLEMVKIIVCSQQTIDKFKRTMFYLKQKCSMTIKNGTKSSVYGQIISASSKLLELMNDPEYVN